MRIRSHHATRPKFGETRNGDAVVVRTDGEQFLVSVVDALGHGPTAAEVARKASEFLESASLDLGVKAIVEGVHRALRGSRGAAAMICVLRDGWLSGCGVGNVELRVQGAAGLPVVLSPGVLGGSVRNMRIFEGEVGIGNRLLLFSDGISMRSPFDETRRLSPIDASELLMERYSHAHDDATILIVDIDK